MDASNFGGSITDILAAGLNPLLALWYEFIAYLPQLIGALIILVVGWIIAVILGNLTTRVIRFSGIDGWMQRSGLHERLRMDIGARFSLISSMAGTFVKWLVMLGVIGVAANA